MKKRIVCLLLAMVLTLGVISEVSAVELHGMNDIVGHWAENDIAWVLDLGLFNGTSANTFNPNGSMTRGMFVTVLGRYAGIDPDEYDNWYLPELYKDVDGDAYYAPYINWATRHGITSGTGNGTFSPDQPITREQMATFLLRFANCYGYVFEPIRDDVPAAFADAKQIAGYAAQAVEIMRESGIITGRPNANGSYNFDPRAYATRSECSAVFHRLLSSMVIDEDFFFEEPEEIAVFGHEGVDLNPGDTLQLEYETIPMKPTNDTIVWISSDPDVASVDSNGLVTCNGIGEAEIYAYTCNGCFDYVVIDSEHYIGYKGESYESKCLNVFGKVVEEHRWPYGKNAPKSAYEANYEYVTVKTWDFKDKSRTEKITRTHTFYVHKNLAPTVKLCFQEIYECEEKYPINSIISYWSSSGKSEHNPGTAIDINWESNPYMSPSGKIITGKRWDPENDPYAIPVGGEIEQIFEKYGFRRGTWWSSGYKDYMHFSFFGY